ncbi:putative teichuronic acid biosynthesis glycosyltransferase TuaH [Betaproteobacteria bacterium MOLA814]|nr:putative teichuronic acid biosynthesis glycosyltransferase TuaH [Betaproteobacteria bacterium MOLA814]
MIVVNLPQFPFRGYSAPYLWMFYKFLLSTKGDLHFFAHKDYLKDAASWAESDRWEFQEGSQRNLGYEIPTSVQLAEVSCSLMSDEIFDKILASSKGNPLKAFEKILSEVVYELSEFYDVELEVMSKSKHVKAILTPINCPSLQYVARERGIPLIHFELGPLRRPGYIDLAYFDFNGLNDKSEFTDRFHRFKSTLPTKNAADLSSVRRQYLSGDSWLSKPVARAAKFDVGVILQIEDDTNLIASSNGYSNQALIAYSKIKFSSKLVAYKAHPGSFFDFKIEKGGVAYNSGTDFLFDCDSILTINSSMGFEALLWEKQVNIVGHAAYASIAVISDEDDRNLALSFFLKNYLVPFELIFNREYIEFRLSNPGESDMENMHLTEVVRNRTDEVERLHEQLQRNAAESDGKITQLHEQLQRNAAESDGKITQLHEQLQRNAAESDGKITQLHEQLWLQLASLNQTVTERDSYIVNLNLKAEEVSIWAHSLQHALTEKQAELSKISDWANATAAMALELNNLKLPFITKAVNALSRIKSRIRARLVRSYVGSIARYIRDTRRYRTNKVSLKVLRESLADSNGRLIITFPIITWDFRWQRPQHIVTRLRDRGFAFLYIAMTIAPLARRFREPKETGIYLRLNNLAKNIDQVWLHSAKQLNIYTDPIEGDDLYNLTLSLEALIHELQPKSIHYLLHFPGWWPVAKELRKRLGGKVIFDCMDEHSGFSTNTHSALNTEHDLIEQADLVITSSAVLENKCQSINPNTIQVKNGTEFDHFHGSKMNGILDHLSNLPIIGYYGAISDWFDMTIVEYCARQHPDWNFILIGSTFGADLQSITGLKNVHLLGEIPYNELPGYFAYFDVCIIPFKIIPLTLATNPVKFYEFMSAGKPVVSVDLPELRAYREDCYLAHNSEEFSTQLEQAYKEREDINKIERRIKLAKDNSWDIRVRSILESGIFETNFNKIGNHE